MKIAVISHTRVPTLPAVNSGLSLSAWEIATGLLELGHDVTLLAGPGSHFNGRLAIYTSEAEIGSQFDLRPYAAILDTSHDHWLSKINPRAPIVNRMADRECRYRPPNVIVNSPHMQNIYGGKLVNTGIRPFADDVPTERNEGEALFMSSHDVGQGLDIAQRICVQTGFGLLTPRNLHGRDKWQALATATVLLCPSTIQAAPRLPLEAAMVGTPTLCLNADGTAYHVADEVSGYICNSEREMAEKMNCLHFIEPLACWQWVTENHNYDEMIAGYEVLLTAVSKGERWQA